MKIFLFYVSTLAITLVSVIYFYHFERQIFVAYLVPEGMIFELGTVLFFFAAFIYCLREYFFKSRHFVYLILSLLFFFVAGEELSWGQHFFDFKSPQFFKVHNAQAETNLHNMIIAGKKINVYLFSGLLDFLIIIYFVVFPILYRDSLSMREAIHRYHLPIPKLYVVLGFIFSVHFTVFFIDHSRVWEINEFIYALTAFVIVIDPLRSTPEGSFQRRLGQRSSF